ncbi:tetratricopeptide repeat protein [Actinoplanes flavus]|uniref:Tetratricopeptide repeat protein n=1 Tax=Actinoplanes flavus TaxID=2820290 RepID=A0ABS3UTM2_9ACTN|nr:tetratricopeptide repeat protein [Actinoplanes flavus]MBO3741914.1 tetratricopeptide repeat protein [Actinoplanes flavus]
MITGLLLGAAGFEVLVGGEPVGGHRKLDAADVELLQGVAGRYVEAIRARADDAVFVGLGRELFGWLDGGGEMVSARWERATAPMVFEVRAPQSPSAAVWAVLRAPWEVLADQNGFLAADGLRRFEVVRRLGTPTAAPPLDDLRLGLMFMASAPRGQHELDFEAEESAILTAVGDTRMDLVVEDTGDPEQLGPRWADLGGLPVLHLSCHGVNNWRTSPDGPRVPVLMMEDEVGDGRAVTAAELIRRLSPMPRLMVVSACLTATAADADGHPPGGPDHRSPGTPDDGGAAPGEVAHSLSTGLVRAGVPAVIGWDGSVTDGAATVFAQHLYEQLGLRQELAAAVGDARRELMACEHPRLRADWHLARIWLGPSGGGPLVAGTRKRQLMPALHGTKTFLDLKRRHVPVATAEMFVGRRREMRRALRVLRGGDRAGVLLHGQGRLGKSSLAARLADRFTDHAVAVVFGDYTAMGVLDAIATAVEDNPAARSLIEKRRAEVRDQPEALRWVLVDLLSGPCAQTGEDLQRPLLLIIDDLERILESRPDAPHQVAAGYAPVLTAVLHAFDPGRSDSRVVLTSRFVFTLDGLHQRLEPVQLAPLSEVAQQKLAVRQRAVPPEQVRESRAGLAARAVAVSRGNPGLQDLIALRLVYSPQVDPARAELAVTEIESYLDRGDLPADTEVRAFVENLALDALIEQAGPAHIALLRALTLFELPMPAPVVDRLQTRTAGSVGRLRDLGLVDTFPDAHLQGETATAVNALAAGRLTPLTATERTEIATEVVPVLLAAWGGPEGQPHWGPDLDVQLTRLALLADDPATIALCAAYAVQALLAGPAAKALALGQQAIGVLERHSLPVPLLLLRRAAEAAQTSGDGDTAAAFFDRATTEASRAGTAADPLDQARIKAEHAYFLTTRGELERAEQLLYQARDMFTVGGSEREVALVWGRIADLRYRRGDYDEALRIYQEVELPVYERIGDARSAASTWGNIANIVLRRGDYDEALRIRKDVALPVYERLGDTRFIALTWGTIADIRYDQGEYDEALRIREEVELPVYERLGDTHAIALTWGTIADIRYRRGDYEESLRIRHEIELPAYERIGDTRSTAITWGKIADIRFQRGDYDEALRIRREKQLPVYERIGDTHSAAVTWGKITDILQQRGDYDEALRIHHEIELPAYERLGDIRETAITWGKIADIRYDRGDYDEALRIRREVELPVYERIGDTRSIAITWGQVADILRQRGDHDEALRIRQEKVLPAAERLNDLDGIANVNWGIAEIYLDRQEFEAAAPYLIKAYQILDHLQRPDGLALVGNVLGQLLIAYGERDTARTVLEKSLAAARKIGNTSLVDHVRGLLDRIGAGAEADPGA